MKKIKTLIFIFLIFILTSTEVFAAPATIIYEGELNYPPFHTLDKNDMPEGFDVDLTKLIVKSEDYQVTYSINDWNKVYGDLKNGKIDTCGLAAINEDRKKEVLFSKVVMQFNVSIYVKKGFKDKITLQNLKNYKVAVGKGQYTEKILTDKLGIKNYHTYPDIQQAIDALNDGDEEVLFENQEVVNYSLIQKGLKDEIVPELTNLYPQDVAFAVRKDNPELVSYINSRLEVLQNSGVYEELYQKYFIAHSKNYLENERMKILKISVVIIIILIILGFLTRRYINFLRKKIFVINDELFKQREWLNTTLFSIGDAVIATDTEAVVNFINPAALSLIGINEAEAMGKKVEDVLTILNEGENSKKEFGIYKIIKEKRTSKQNEYATLLSRDGITHDISHSESPIVDENKNIIGTVIIFKDVTEKRKQEIELQESYEELETLHEELSATEEELRHQYTELQISQDSLSKSEERYRLALEGANDGLWDCDFTNDSILYSPKCLSMLGYKSNELKISFSTFSKLIHEDNLSSFIEVYRNHIEGRTPYFSIELMLKTKDGEYKWFLARGKAIFNWKKQPIRMAGSLTDITERKKTEGLIYNMAYYDTLTGLCNRSTFEGKLSDHIKLAEQFNQEIAVLFLDLDNFKTFNDTYGHYFGDNLLIKVSEILKTCCNGNYVVARLGGDEFAILKNQVEISSEVISLAETILKSLSDPIIVEGKEVYITTSVGIAVYPSDGTDVQTLLSNADAAMYVAKESGKNNYKMHDKQMSDKVAERLNLENELRYALKRKEFIMYYQPKVNIITGEIEGMEALLRWKKQDTIISPLKFIPAAEESGLIILIGEAALRSACIQNKRWQDLGFKPLRVAVNLSARQFQEKTLLSMIKKILEETCLDPKWLELEITESIAMKDFNYTIEVLNDLQSMGIHISLDDFGTGYSSLNYLKSLPINTLKIDKSFVDDIIVSPTGKDISKAVIMLAHSFNLTVVAEGVETKEQLKLLKNQGCDAVQGYLFSKPLDADAFEDMIKKGCKLM